MKTSKQLKSRMIKWVSITIVLASCLMVLPSWNLVKAEKPFNLLCYNLRYDNPQDGINTWNNRKHFISDMIKFYDIDLLCVQEALHNQLNDLLKEAPDLSFVGVGRDDGNTKGEYAAILYNTKRFQLVNSGNFWLSEDPETPSMGWDAACIRVCSWAEFKPIDGSKSFFVFNAHFDHVGEIARLESAKLIVKKVTGIVKNSPVIITGDFNTTPETEAIKTISETFNDTYSSSLQKHYGPEGTWNAFDYQSPLDTRIDYCFASKHLEVLKHAHLDDARDGRFHSDHLPVFVKLFVR